VHQQLRVVGRPHARLPAQGGSLRAGRGLHVVQAAAAGVREPTRFSRPRRHGLVLRPLVRRVGSGAWVGAFGLHVTQPAALCTATTHHSSHRRRAPRPRPFPFHSRSHSTPTLKLARAHHACPVNMGAHRIWQAGGGHPLPAGWGRPAHLRGLDRVGLRAPWQDFAVGHAPGHRRGGRGGARAEVRDARPRGAHGPRLLAERAHRAGRAPHLQGTRFYASLWIASSGVLPFGKCCSRAHFEYMACLFLLIVLYLIVLYCAVAP